MATNRPWNWRLTVLKTIKKKKSRPLITNFKMTVRADCAVSACSPLPPSINVLAHWLSVGGSQPLDRGPPSPSVASIHNKANFPFHQPCLFIGFWAVSSRTPLLVTQGVLERKWPTPEEEPVSGREPCLQCSKKWTFREVRYRGDIVR